MLLYGKTLMARAKCFLVLTAIVNASASAADWEIDAAHSTAIFSVQHMNAGLTYGRFNTMEGKINYDEKTPENGSVEFKIKVDSVDTANAKRDGHLKNNDFFDAKAHREITFKSSKITVKSPDNFDVEGDLTLHGQTKKVTLPVKKTGTGSAKGKQLVGFLVQTTLKRSDYGMNKLLDAAGDEVGIIVAIEAVK